MRRVSLLLVLAGACLAPAARADFPSGKPAPAFTLKKLDGKPLSLTSLQGKVVLLDFWGPS
jgi:cytochrome c biogenesis protein CcmG, thiol:disulfide interchange protein DsbE